MIKINGKEIKTSSGQTILDAAISAGIDIPTLCYFAGLNNIGACKLCVCEIEGRDELVTSCNTLIEDGMSILTESEKVVEARKQILHLIIANHDFNCEECASKGRCQLLSNLKRYGIEAPVYKGNIVNASKKESSPFLTYDPQICINCKRCVAACKKLACNGVLEPGKIGSKSFINAPFGKN